jgi:hypothetical protein
MLKLILGILCVVFVCAVFGVGYVWYKVAFVAAPIVATTSISDFARDALTSVADTQPTEGTPTAADAEATGSQSSVNSPSLTLTEDQRKLLAAFGVEPETLVITEAMVACAQTELGEARISDIAKGDTPSIAEGFALFACFNKN